MFKENFNFNKYKLLVNPPPHKSRQVNEYDCTQPAVGSEYET